MSLDGTDDQSTSVHVMAWCRQTYNELTFWPLGDVTVIFNVYISNMFGDQYLKSFYEFSSALY